MTLRTKIGALIAVLIIGVGGAVGGISIFAYYQLAVARIDSAVNACATEVAAAQGDRIGSALFTVRSQDVGVALAFRSLDGELTLLHDGGIPFTPLPTVQTLRRASQQALTISGNTTYRLRTVELPDNEFLLFGVGLGRAESERAKSVRLLTLVVLGMTGFGIFLSRRVTKGDLDEIERLTQSAESIANGHEVRFTPTAASSTEVARLRLALVGMSDTISRALDETTEANRQLTEFLGDASHELRTPLTVLTGYMDLLQHYEVLEPEVRMRAVTRCTEEIAKMEKLVADLLLLARLGESSLDISATVDLSALVWTQLDDLKYLQPTRRIETEIQQPCVVHGDVRALTSFCSNVFSNLRQHTAESDRVQICLESDSHEVRLSVDDAGPGYPAELLSESHGALPRFSKSLAQETGGFGLGLHLMQSIAEAHGGALRLAHSRLGGARVVLVLPKPTD